MHHLCGEKSLENKADTVEIGAEGGSDTLRTSLSAWIQPGLKPTSSGIFQRLPLHVKTV